MSVQNYSAAGRFEDQFLLRSATGPTSEAQHVALKRTFLRSKRRMLRFAASNYVRSDYIARRQKSSDFFGDLAPENVSLAV